jgi:PKD repeat protein
MFSWDFGDGSPIITTAASSVFHTFTTPNTYTVTMNVTDSASQFSTTNQSVTVYEWPISSSTAFGWVIHWNITSDDGVSIWNVTYNGKIIIRDARLTAVQVLYLNNLCGPFLDEPTLSDMTTVKNVGNISYYQNLTDPSNPYFQLTSEWHVGGYDYTEAFRFYMNGMWQPILMIGRDGCPADHIYEPHWRIDLALTEDSNNYMSTYTPQGSWQDLLWEGNYTDNGFRDLAHNQTAWRYADQGRFYYISPTIIRWDVDLPSLSSDLILVRNHPNEIETPPHYEFGHVESPTEWINGELAFRRDIAFWWVPKMWDHGPVTGLYPGLKIAYLTFYPGGTWA